MYGEVQINSHWTMVNIETKLIDGKIQFIVKVGDNFLVVVNDWPDMEEINAIPNNIEKYNVYEGDDFLKQLNK